MAPSILQFDARRARSYIFRLPLCTRLLLSSTVAFYIASLFLPWFSAWAALIPQEVGLSTSTMRPLYLCRSDDADSSIVYRLNTFPIIHLGFFHVLLNILALTPLLERFECEHGSLVTLILFTGRQYIPRCNSWDVSDYSQRLVPYQVESTSSSNAYCSGATRPYRALGMTWVSNCIA